MKAVSGAGVAALLRELWAWNAAYLCSASPGASLVISETETEGLDKETWGTASVVGLPAGCWLTSSQALPCLPRDIRTFRGL